MGSIVVRRGTTADVGMLAAFNRRMALETEDRVLDRARSEAGVAAVFEDESRGMYFVAEEDGRARGSLFVTREWSDWRDGNFWWIQSVFVEPEARGRGVFRALYDFVLGQARGSSRVCGVRLYVEKDNQRARAVYSAVGMRSSPYRLYEVDFVMGPAERQSQRERS